jgi:ribosomal protein S18 acetylase RimI-like enzyme
VVTVRRAGPNDADAVLTLMAGLGRPAVAGDPGPQRAVFMDHLGYDDAAMFVAELDGEIAGAVSLWLRPRLNLTTLEAWIPDLYVDERFRRRGVARALLDACAALARRRGCHRLTLESGHQRTEAHALYEGYGFTNSGRQYSMSLADATAGAAGAPT